MRCDVVAVGTELLLGQITDTNSQWIGEQLAAAGIDSLLQVKVGDNLGRIEKLLRRVLADADAVIMCGGLGPTHDDLTRDVGKRAVWQPVVPQRVVVNQAIGERRPIHAYGARAWEVTEAFDQLWAKLRRTMRG